MSRMLELKGKITYNKMVRQRRTGPPLFHNRMGDKPYSAF